MNVDQPLPSLQQQTLPHKMASTQVESNPSTSTKEATEKKSADSVVVPSSKGHRPWKQPKRRTASAQRRTSALKFSLEQKNRRRQERDTLRQIAIAAKEADKAAKEAERQRRADKKKRKEENDQRGVQPVVITNPKKLAKMSRKQYLNYVHTHKVLN